MNTSANLAVRPDGVGVLTLDQPGSKVNVLTHSLWHDIDRALDEAAKQPLAGLVIASAKPGIFIAGADLKLLGDAPGPNDPAVRAFIDLGLRSLEKLESLPFPTCAAINGAALGGGLELSLACDYRVVDIHPKVQLGLPEVKLGLIPGWGGTQRLPRIISLEAASKMITTGESLLVSDVILHGLAVSSRTDLMDFDCEEIKSGAWKATRLSKQRPIASEQWVAFKPSIETEPVAVREAVLAMIRGAELPLYEAIKLETEAFMNLAGSPESKRLIAEFFASRKK